MALTVHFESNGAPVCLLLDIIELAQSHSGANLAAAFGRVLNNYGIADKVNVSYKRSYRTVTNFSRSSL